MKIVVYDPYENELGELCGQLKKSLRSDDEVNGFSYREDMLNYAKEHLTDAAFISLYCDHAEGLQYAADLNKVNGKMNIVFISENDMYMKEAFAERSSGFLNRPLSNEDIRNEMQNLRYHIEEFRKSRD